MTTPSIDTIRGRHYMCCADDNVCAYDEMSWPCDASILLGLLDAAVADIQECYDIIDVSAEVADPTYKTPTYNEVIEYITAGDK